VLKIGSTNIKIEGRAIRVARLDEDKYQFPDDPAGIVDGLRHAGERVDLFTFLQKPAEAPAKYSYAAEQDNLAVLPVSTYDHWFKNQIRSLPRNRARQAEKRGVVLREIALDDFLLEGICGIYNESPIRQGRRFPHYGMTVERARSYAGTYPDRSVYIGALFENRLIGFVKLTWDDTRTNACLVHILSMIQHREKAPTNALIAHAVKACAERGIPNLIYQNFSYGKGQQDTLSHFKEINGFERIDLARYYVPLTSLGSLAFRLKLHHRLSDRLPESVGGKLREFRRVWYGRRFPEATSA
jgi:hypothetical protein